MLINKTIYYKSSKHSHSVKSLRNIKHHVIQKSNFKTYAVFIYIRNTEYLFKPYLYNIQGEFSMVDNDLRILNYLIQGLKGPYDKNTSIGKAANAGNEVANLLKDDNLWRLVHSDIKYAGVDTFAGNGWSHKSVNINDSLAFSTEALTGYDKNGDGTVTTEEFNAVYIGRIGADKPEGVQWMPNPNALKYASTVDLNSDGKIDAGELSAWTIYQDGQDGLSYAQQGGTTTSGSRPASAYNRNIVDGKVTEEQAKMAETELCRDPNAVKATLKRIYSENNIAEKEETFEMPEKVDDPKPPVCNNNKLLKLLMMLIRMMFGGFGGGRCSEPYLTGYGPQNTGWTNWSDGSIAY